MAKMITMPDIYDDKIKASAARYLDGVDWRLVKAQLYQESRLDPDAVSPVGAQGIAQFMPPTWSDMKIQMDLPTDASPFNVTYAVPAMCYYMSRLHQQWSAQREDADRYALALASYNAGTRNLLKAQKLAGGARSYSRIIGELHRITGDDHARETCTYVERIFGYFVHQIING